MNLNHAAEPPTKRFQLNRGSNLETLEPIMFEPRSNSLNSTYGFNFPILTKEESCFKLATGSVVIVKKLNTQTQIFLYPYLCNLIVLY